MTLWRGGFVVDNPAGGLYLFLFGPYVPIV